MGQIVVLYGPSASGKTQIQQQLTSPQLPKIITATTREPRAGEVDGVHYWFLDNQQFLDKMEQNALVEWTNYNGQYYGTLRSSIEEVISGPHNANIILDLSGVLALQKYYAQHITAIYIGADLSSLSRRLAERGSDLAEVAARLRKAEEEELNSRYMEAANAVVWNNDDTDFAETLSQVKKIIAVRGMSTNMENVSSVDKLESIKSFQSTIRKSEKALAQMTEKGANTTLLIKRLKALHIGLTMLENIWNQRPHHYTEEDLAETHNVLTGLFPSIESTYAKSKAGSPQRTLLERRIKAFELAIQAIDDLSNE
ncbi:guanylate kinase [Paenibacillus sp. 19GGS1-52]|nr:guanylate kinase [Paenibacillus sp. 19GGS1-52]